MARHRHGLGSSTYDFIMGETARLDGPPSNHDVALAIIDTLDDLWIDDVLWPYVEARSFDDAENWQLKAAVTALRPERLETLSNDAGARPLFTTKGTGGSEAHFYVGVGKDARGAVKPILFWFERHAAATVTYTAYEELDVRSLCDVLDDYEFPIGSLLFNALVSNLNEHAQTQLDRFLKLNAAVTALKLRTQVVKQLYLNGPIVLNTKGDGVEG